MSKPKVIFFGNGPLAENALKVLEPKTNIIFHAHDKGDLEKVKELKKKNPDAFGILASFGVLIKKDLLDLFEPTGGILNIHPSLLPKYRGPSPIETAILNADRSFGVSVMKLVEKMDAGPIYYQTTKQYDYDPYKHEIYEDLATIGAKWLIKNLEHLPNPEPQNDKDATYTKKLDTSMSRLDPIKHTSVELYNQVYAFADFPKSRIEIDGVDCIILEAQAVRAFNLFEQDCLPPGDWFNDPHMMALTCADGNYLVVERLQPAGKKPMSAQDFINGHGTDWQHEFTGIPDLPRGFF